MCFKLESLIFFIKVNVGELQQLIASMLSSLDNEKQTFILICKSKLKSKQWQSANFWLSNQVKIVSHNNLECFILKFVWFNSINH